MTGQAVGRRHGHGGPETALDAPSTTALADLVERSRRLGADRSLVVLGGGNTSAKGEAVDVRGQRRPVMWVKGSGAALDGSAAGDYPALWLDELLPLQQRDAMDDEEMTDLVARALLDPAARRPSIETLLHAFLPAAHVDHVHADAICALTNHAEGERTTREALGEGFAYVDWIRPGFELSRLVGELAGYEGVVLAHHGLVTWADDSAACYERTMDAVDRARAYLDEHTVPSDPPRTVPDVPEEELDRLLLHLRGALSRTGRRVLHVDRRLRAVADRPDVDTVVAAGVASADHMFTVKPWSAVVPDVGAAEEAVEAYAARYTDYVERQAAAQGADVAPHDPMPRVMLVPGLGAVTTGSTAKDARTAAEVALHTHGVAASVTDAFGAPEALPESEVFGFDYWPMELYKATLKPPKPPFAGFVAVITGAASGIGRGIARHLAARGASLVLADLDGDGLEQAAGELTALGAVDPQLVTGDQSDAATVDQTIRAAVRAFGGVDGAVMSAGVAVTGDLVDVDDATWARSMSVNLTSAFLLTRAAMRAFTEQGSGGSLVYVASKNAFGPGAGFGPYSVAKAGMVQLCRIAALEGGPIGVRANAVNPDGVFDGSRLWTDEMRADRARHHGVAPDELASFYAQRNLLGAQVRTEHVAAAVEFLLSDGADRTTGAVLPVDGGVATAFPR